MHFSQQQQRALDKVAAWLHSDQQVFTLFGYAGTGKTTLAKHLGADFYAAYTGKAAFVLRGKGCPGASTIHSLIYHPKEKSQLRLYSLIAEQQEDPTPERAQAIEVERANLRRVSFTLNIDSPLRGARLLVIDECSMVNEEIGRDLESFGCKILVLGDPAQLPPVMGGGYYTNREPDVLLTEVHRQAADSPIVSLATHIRTRGALPTHHPLLRSRGTLTPDDALAMDQLIVGRNRTRHTTNQRMRTLLGFTGDFPQPGERVVCLKNNHMLGILNGALYTVVSSCGDRDWVEMTIADELTGINIDAMVNPEPFRGEEVPYENQRDYDTFDYGYALTCHKCQGSQWNKVGVINESGAFRQDAARWLYTAVTRAAEELWVAS